jgi:hypothetical protein
MVWIGGPRRDPGDRLGRGRRGLYLHDPPPGYHPPAQRSMPLKDQQRRARQDWILEHVLAVVLILLAVAVTVIICVIIATHH